MPVNLSNGIAEQKQQSNLHTGGLTDIQTGCLGAQHGEQSLTVLNRCGMLVFNDEWYLKCFENYDIYMKIK